MTAQDKTRNRSTSLARGKLGKIVDAVEVITNELSNKTSLRQLKVSLKAASRRSRDAVRDRTGQDAESLDKSRSW